MVTNEIKTSGSEVKPAPCQSATEIAEQLLGKIDWISSDEGYCKCPGQDQHTTKNCHRDCKVYLEKVPTIFCLHSGCRLKLEEVNKTLRRNIGRGIGGGDYKLTREDKERLKQLNRKENLRRRARYSKEAILNQNRWTYEQIKLDSPVRVDVNPEEHWRLLLNQFQPGDVVWIGNIYDSGKSEHSKHFRPIEQWLRETVVPAQFTCPAVFKTGSFARSNENVMARRFLVVESDTLSRDEVGAVFKWMRDAAKLKLRAVVDTGGKSLHAWFDYPADDQIADLKLILPELGCDPKLFTASQPVRLPGAQRDGKRQQLIYLGKEEV